MDPIRKRLTQADDLSLQIPQRMARFIDLEPRQKKNILLEKGSRRYLIRVSKTRHGRLYSLRRRWRLYLIFTGHRVGDVLDLVPAGVVNGTTNTFRVLTVV